MNIFINANGTIQYVYTDDLVGVFDGDAKVRRASNVEPHPNGGWQADMSPVGGPVLLDGSAGFVTRAEALDKEREWLDAQLVNGELITKG